MIAEHRIEVGRERTFLRVGAIVACIALLAGCGTAPSAPASTGYKGAAVWNISRGDPAGKSDRANDRSVAPTTGPGTAS